MLKETIKKLVERQSLSQEQASAVMNEIMEGKASSAQISAIITALRMKGETVAEISGFADSMRKHAAFIKPRVKKLVDTCGTGGDISGTFNISTISALVAAGAGAVIAKHGNRSVSSQCGSADLLEALGVKIEIPPQKVSACIEKVGLGFMFAPVFHQSMKHAAPVRKEIGIRTVFNILGPLTNPANASAQVLGVFAEKLTGIMAEVLKNLGVAEALVVHGSDGLDEISISDATKISHLKDKTIKTYQISPQDFGLKRGKMKDLLGGEASQNVKITREILSGRDQSSRRDIILLNAAAALLVAGKTRDLKSGIGLAAESIDTGRADEKLNKLIEFTNKSSGGF